jgi:hypothetical protein
MSVLVDRTAHELVGGNRIEDDQLVSILDDGGAQEFLIRIDPAKTAISVQP